MNDREIARVVQAQFYAQTGIRPATAYAEATTRGMDAARDD